jgi:phage terminase large subunit-like protein
MLLSLSDYEAFVEKSSQLDPKERSTIYRHLGRVDLFFLLWFILKRNDIFKPWLLDRCKEVQSEPDGCIDLWAREHYKSTIITFAKTIQDILASHGENAIYDKERTFGIFSCTRPIAKGFLRQIKREFEANQLLRSLYPDVIWENPHRDAPKWSEDDGLVLKRKSNPKESTIEAWGLIDGQPTSKHFTDCVYDDVVTVDNCRSPEMIAKTTEAWEISINLGSEGGRRRYVGTRYHFADTYKTMIDRGVATVRVHAATDNGEPDGNPVFMSPEYLADKKLNMGSYTFSCQMLLNPIKDSIFKLKIEHLQFYSLNTDVQGNTYILVDPANSKRKSSDYTAIWVITVSHDGNYYVRDIVRDKLNLSERSALLFELHRKWRPLGVGYEQYGLSVDIQHCESKMREQNYHFSITPLGGRLSKFDRIKNLTPLLESNKIFLPQMLVKKNYEGREVDLIQAFINEEYLQFPLAEHDDMLDALARITDEKLNIIFPRIYEEPKRGRYNFDRNDEASAWAS